MEVAGTSLFIFGPDNCLRNFLRKVISHPYYDEFIYGLIAASSLVLAIDEPNISDFKKQVVDICHLVFLGFFILEATIKIIVMGFSCG